MMIDIKVLLSFTKWPDAQKIIETINGKERTHYEPNQSLRLIHEYALQKLFKKKIKLPSAKGWRKLAKIKNHFFTHTNRHGHFHDFWYVTDIKGAYESVELNELTNILMKIFFEKWMVKTSAGLYYSRGIYLEKYSILQAYLKKFFFTPVTGVGLAEGYPASPYLFNVYAEFEIDGQLRNFCKENNLTYTRYGDDLIFTSEQPIGKKKRKEILKLIRYRKAERFFRKPPLSLLSKTTIKAEPVPPRFEINQKKTEYFQLSKQEGGKILNGVGIRNRGNQAEIFLPGFQRKRLQSLLYQAIKGRTADYEVIEGLMGYFKMCTDDVGRNLGYATRAEEKIYKLYHQYRACLRKRKQIPPKPKEQLCLGI